MAFGVVAVGRLVPDGRAISSRISALAKETLESSLPLAPCEAMRTADYEQGSGPQ